MVEIPPGRAIGDPLAERGMGETFSSILAIFPELDTDHGDAGVTPFRETRSGMCPRSGFPP